MKKSTATTTPIAVWASIATSLVGLIWIDAFEPTNPHLTVEGSQSWSAILIGAAAIAGTILGIRLLWSLWVFYAAIGAGFTVSTMSSDGFTTQLVGGSILTVASLVLILLPSVIRYENKRLRLNVEDPDDPDHPRSVPVGLLLLAVVLVVLLGFITSAD